MKKRILIIFLALAASLSSITATAQTPQFFNANNSNSNNNWPLNAASQINNRCQWIYGPNLFTSLGNGLGTPAYNGLITDVYFRLGSSTNPNSVYNINMAIGQNVGTQTAFPNGTYITGLTPVLVSTSYSLTGATNFAWYRVTLPTPFAYNPNASLVFEIYQAGTGGGNLLSQNTSLPGNRIYGGTTATGGVLGNGLVDFGFDMMPAGPYDPAVTNIQVAPTSGCLDSNGTIILTIPNMGSQILDLSLNPLIYRININGPNGLVVIQDTLNTGILQPNGANNTFVVVSPVNFYTGGTYTINTDTLSLIGLTNTNYVNDSLSNAVVITNTRPNNVGDITLCTGDTIATGNGLSIANCPGGFVQDSVLIPFNISFTGNNPPNPTSTTAQGSSQFATGVLPALPAGANILSGELGVSNLQACCGFLVFTTNPTLTRFSLFDGTTPPPAGNIYHTGLQGSNLTGNPGTFNYVSNPPAADLTAMYANIGVGNTVNMGHWNLTFPTGPNVSINSGGTTTAYLKIIYEYIPQGVSWYEQPSGGLSISNASIFNPLLTANSILNNTNTPGTYTFYGACLADTNCRVAANVIISTLDFASVIDTAIQCFGETTGSVQAIMAGPPATYTFTLTQGATQVGQNQSGYFNNLAAGTYNLNVLGVGCSGDTTITITQPPLLDITNLATTQPNCNPGNNGSIIVTATGGTPPYNYSIGTPPGQLGNTFTGLGAGPYLVTVTDDNGCQDTSSVTLAAPGGPTLTAVSANNVLCNGDSTGSISFISVPGASTAVIDSIIAPAVWAQQVVGGNVTGLPAGSYTIQASDANGCAVTNVVNITEPNPLIFATATSTDASCNGLSDGTISVSGSGGTIPYVGFSISPNVGTQPTSGNFIGLPDGVYTITLTDANNCTTTTNITINEPAPVSFTNVAVDSVDCNGGNDGSIVVTGAGAPPLAYNITAPAPLPSSPPGTFSNLSANTYTVRISDANNCFVDSNITVGEPAAFTISPTASTNIDCQGDSTGSITVVNNGGVGNITYTIAPYPSATQVPNGTFVALPAGTYTITGTDANLCATTTTVTLTEPNSSVQITSIVGTTPSCNPGSDGSITVIGSGGTGTIQYRYNNGPLQNPGFFNNLNSGNHLLTAEDANGCRVDSLFNLTNSSSPAWTSVSKVDVSCNGDSTGTITGLATGGAGGITYALNPYAGSPAPVGGNFTGLPAGTYSITASDANNCSISSAVVINENPVIAISNVVIDSVDCNGGNTGSITLNATGGSSGLSGSRLPGNVAANPNTPPNFTFGGLTAQTYTVRLTDALGCTRDSIVTVFEPNAISVDTTAVSDVLCNGDNSGSIYIQSSGGTGPISYSIPSISATSASGLFTNLQAGPYTVVSTDAKNCIANTSLTVLQPAPLSHTVSVTGAQCFGDTSGTIICEGIGGGGTYTYTLYPNNTNNGTGTFTGLGAGSNYQVVITDNNGCTDTTALLTIIEPTQMVFTSVNKQDIECFGGATGSITVASNMGTGVHTYDINPSAGVLQAPSGNFTLVPAGTYIITATDANLCTITTSVTVLENDEIIFDNITQTEPTCFGDESGSVSFSATGGVGPFTYLFDNTPPASGQTTYNNLSVGAYTIRAIDALGCTKDTLYNLTGPDRITFSEFDAVGTICLDTEDGKLTATAIGGRGGRYTYTLEPGFYVTANGIFRNLAANTYTLRVMDTAGCFLDTVFTINLPSDPLTVNIQKEDLKCIGRGNEGTAEAVTSGGTPPYTYLWNSTPVQTSSIASNLYQGLHQVDVVDAQGCLVRDSVFIEPGPCCTEVFLPNAFSPNDDGNNDEFRILSTAGIELTQFEVYNRWGIRVWQTNNTRSSWDGQYGGEKAEAGTYHYVMRYKCLTDGQNYTKKGDITIVR